MTKRYKYDQWSTSAFNVDPSFIKRNNTVRIDTDSTNTGCWWVECDGGQLIINPYQRA